MFVLNIYSIKQLILGGFMILISGKVDPRLEIAVQLDENERKIDKDIMTGYNNITKTWRLIVKYYGDIHLISKKYGAFAETLTEKYAIVTIPESMIPSFANEISIEYIEKPKKLSPNLNINLSETCIPPVQNYPQFELKGEGVLIGIIDSGIDYMHPDFINDDNTSRILYIWDQSASRNYPESFLHGREYTNEEINTAISLNISGKEENALNHYDFIGHGTHVAGIAAGNGRASNGLYIGAAPMSNLIVVKMGNPDYEGYPINNIDIMQGIKYILQKAMVLQMPVAINISYGSNIGSHDGNSLFETYINEMSLQWKNAIVVAMGNEGDKGTHTHGNIMEKNRSQFTIEGNLNTISVDIWKTQMDFFNVEILSPRGISTGIIPYKNNNLLYNIGTEKIYIRFNKSTPYSINENISIELIAVNKFLSQGIWTIVFHDYYVINGEYHIWLSTGEKFSSVKFLTPTENSTYTLPSTVKNVISVGGYNGITGKLSTFSGRGNERDPVNIKPDICAPCEKIISCVPGGGYDAYTGTSMAAPFVTGASALLLEWGILLGNDPYLYGQSLKGYLCSGAKRDRNLKYPSNTWGYGKLCLLNSMEILTGIIQMRYREKNEHMDENVSEIENKIISEDFVDFIVEFNNDLINLANSNEDVIIGKVLRYNLATVYVKRELVDSIIDEIVVMSDLSYPLLFNVTDMDSLTDANIMPILTNPNLNLKGNGVIVGFVDTGIDYTHPAFRYEDGTSKILSIWDQTIFTGNPPLGFRYGTEYTNEQINEALKSENPFDIVPSNDTIGHGTFLAGIACGRQERRYSGVAPDAKIIFVKLAPAKEYAKVNSMIFDENVTVYQDTDILLGLLYLLEKSEEFNMPISINFGLGTNQGGHDGLTYFPLTGNERGAVLTVSGGNEGNSRRHTTGQIKNDNAIYSIEMNVAENEKGTAIYIWNYSPDKISISVMSPSGEMIEKIPVKNTFQNKFKLVFHETTIWVSYYISVDRNGDQLTVIRFMNPESGIWRITLYGETIINGTFHAWLPSNGLSLKNTFFLNSSPDYTITEIGNSSQVICVCAYNHKNQNLFIESGRGPARYNTIRPDIIAPGVDVMGPSPGGGYSTLSGSSVAAAHVAGAAAIILQWGIVNKNFIGMNGNIIKSFLLEGAKRQKGIYYPNNQYGYGQLDLLNTFKEMATIQFKTNYNFYIDSIGLRKSIERKKREFDRLVLAMVLFDDLRSYMLKSNQI